MHESKKQPANCQTHLIPLFFVKKLLFNKENAFPIHFSCLCYFQIIHKATVFIFVTTCIIKPRGRIHIHLELRRLVKKLPSEKSKFWTRYISDTHLSSLMFSLNDIINKGGMPYIRVYV